MLIAEESEVGTGAKQGEGERRGDYDRGNNLSKGLYLMTQEGFKDGSSFRGKSCGELTRWSGG